MADAHDARCERDDLAAARGIVIASLSGGVFWALVALAVMYMVSPS